MAGLFARVDAAAGDQGGWQVQRFHLQQGGQHRGKDPRPERLTSERLTVWTNCRSGRRAAYYDSDRSGHDRDGRQRSRPRQWQFDQHRQIRLPKQDLQQLGDLGLAGLRQAEELESLDAVGGGEPSYRGRGLGRFVVRDLGDNRTADAGPEMSELSHCRRHAPILQRHTAHKSADGLGQSGRLIACPAAAGERPDNHRAEAVRLHLPMPRFTVADTASRQHHGTIQGQTEFVVGRELNHPPRPDLSTR